jgi:hypothetical protein
VPDESRPHRVVEAVELIRAVAAASLVDAFAVWSQTMVVEYLLCCPPRPGLPDVVDRLRDAQITGATGMAPAVADAGQVPLPLSAEADGDGWRLTGTAPWASNLFDGGVVVFRPEPRTGRRGHDRQQRPESSQLGLVADAVHLDGVLHGGRGFHAASPTARRRREAAFLPVQAPTEIQLRTMLAATVDGGE